LSLAGVDRFPGYVALYVPAAVGGIVGLMVYWFGAVSSANFNPAVTIGLWLLGKLKVQQVALFLIAQLLGALAGLVLVKYFVTILPQAPQATDLASFLAEALGAFILMFTVAKAAMGEIPGGLGGVAIGAALALAITLTQLVSGGVLNPAIALALGARQLPYLLGPIVGGLVGAAAARWISPAKP